MEPAAHGHLLVQRARRGKEGTARRAAADRAAAASPVRGLASFLYVSRAPMHRRVTIAFSVADVPGLSRIQAVLFARLSLGCLAFDD